MANAGGKKGGIEPPSPIVIFLLVVCVGIALLICCSAVARRLRRNRTTRSLVERLTSRLRNSNVTNEANYPAARPSKYMKRFAGVSVVDGNAMVDEVHYERLREFPQALVEVSEVGTNVDSADFSASEVATTTASVYSRSGIGHNHHSQSRQGREGSLSSEPTLYGDNNNNSWSRLSSMVVEPDEMSGARGGGEEGREETELQRFNGNTTSGHIHCVPPSANVEPTSGEFKVNEDDEFGAQPMSRQRSSGGAWRKPIDDSFPTSPVHPTQSSGLGRCVITNISVEDLAAHCAALQEEEDKEETEERREGSGDTPAAIGKKTMPPAASASGTVTASHPSAPQREGATTPLTPYAYIMREKVRRANGVGARSVVVVEPECSSAGSGSEESDASVSTEGEATDAPPQPRRARRTVHREHHRHHTAKGGFIVCEDFVPDLASRRMRRQQTAAKKPRFIFQLRDEETFYGRSQYLPQATEEGEEDGGRQE